MDLKAVIEAESEICRSCLYSYAEPGELYRRCRLQNPLDDCAMSELFDELEEDIKAGYFDLHREEV